MEVRPDPGELGLEVRKCTPNIGAEISGVDLRQKLDQDVVDCVTSLLVDHNVVFFRDQDLTTEQHLAFARRFGEPHVHPFTPNREDYPAVLPLLNDRERPPAINRWHTDVTFLTSPPLGLILRAIRVPTVGGDTLWASMETAYDNLPDEAKDRIDGLTARHDFWGFRRRLRARGVWDDRQIAEFKEKYPNPHHPVVRTHPVSGRKSIFVNSLFTLEIDDMERERRATPCCKNCMPRRASQRLSAASAGTGGRSLSGTTGPLSITPSPTTGPRKGTWKG